MKKVAAGILLVGLVAGGAAYAIVNTPERAVCVKMGELCDVQGGYQDLDACVKQVEELEKVVGKEPVEKAAACVAEANSCVEGSGCLAGAGYSAMPKLMNDFFKGFNRANDK